MEEQSSLMDYGINANWNLYNQSQTREKEIFLNILYELCDLVIDVKNNLGRNPILIKDVIFASVIKQYLNLSSRRLQSDLKLFFNNGFMDSKIHFNTLLNRLESYSLRENLINLIEISSIPLNNIEKDFAIDSTGFSTSRYETFFHYKHGKNVKWRTYRKCHAVCGVKTNIVTSIDITEGKINDSTQFVTLAKNTRRNFNIRDFCADKAYLGGKNFETINELGGKAFIPFKSNTNGKNAGGDRSYFKVAFHLYKNNPKEYMKHYHKRSNIESTFSMIKRKFGNNVRCKKDISQDNEILSKVLAHNICVLIKEMFLRNIEIDFQKLEKRYIALNLNN